MSASERTVLGPSVSGGGLLGRTRAAHRKAAEPSKVDQGHLERTHRAYERGLVCRSAAVTLHDICEGQVVREGGLQACKTTCHARRFYNNAISGFKIIPVPPDMVLSSKAGGGVSSKF